jgi:hypothetical protein
VPRLPRDSGADNSAVCCGRRQAAPDRCGPLRRCRRRGRPPGRDS